ncbi:hypothetical protein B0H13DRAFT_2332965 [Mycena leptocephala]|nr:hypothetical protein B0H13DRAFT_2332965 [Mycena leptocephala]
MATGSRGTPPTQSPPQLATDTAVLKDLDARATDLRTRYQLVEAVNKKTANKVTDPASARQYLEVNHLLEKDTEFSREDLFAALMRMSLLPQASLGKLANALRALAYMGETIDSDYVRAVSDATAEAVSETIAPILDAVVKKQGKMEETVGGLVSTCSIVSASVEETKTEMRALVAQLEVLKTAVETASAASTAAAIEAATAARATPVGPRSYATAAAAPTMTAEQAALLARNARRRRQILVDKPNDATVSAFASLTELQLKAKANLALTLMTSKEEGAAFVGAKRLENGGVIFDCKDEAMATWLKGATVVEEFVAALGGSCVYRPRSVMLIAEMVSVEVRVEEPGTWRVVEADSGLEEGAIVSARWVKAPARRAPNQRVAHLRVEFATAEAANHAIDYGVYWQGTNYRVRKSDEEPRRCVKCQKFDGHIAQACKSAVDVCGRCTRTTERRTAQSRIPGRREEEVEGSDGGVQIYPDLGPKDVGDDGASGDATDGD